LIGLRTTINPLLVSEIWTRSCDNSETVRDRISVTINH